MNVNTVQKIQKASVKTVVVTLQTAFLLGMFLMLILVVAAGMAFATS